MRRTQNRIGQFLRVGPTDSKWLIALLSIDMSGICRAGENTWH